MRHPVFLADSPRGAGASQQVPVNFLNRLKRHHIPTSLARCG